MLSIIRNRNEYIARCGRGEFVLPIVHRRDTESGEPLTEVISASGVRGLFRTAVDVRFEEKKTVNDDGTVSYSHEPVSTVYEHVAPLLEKLALGRYPGWLTRIYRISDPNVASRELGRVMTKTCHLLWKQAWNWDEVTSYEAYANSHQAVVLDGDTPQGTGKFAAELDAQRKLAAAKALVDKGLLSSPCATGVGAPGTSFYLTTRDGYSPTELANPLIHEMPEKRRGVVNAVKNAVEILGAEPSPVHIQGVKRTPPMTNAVVVCMPFAADDSVIISESLANRLTARARRSNWHGIDGVINYRGGLRFTGRNGGLVKREAEWPLNCDRHELEDGAVTLTRREPGNDFLPTVNANAELLRELRRCYEEKWAGMVERLGAYSAEEMKCWKQWLSKQRAWTHRHAKQPMRRRFGFGVERVRVGYPTYYREDLGYSYRKPEVGMKIQSDGDLFKGVVSKILPDEKMPLVELAGKPVRAEVVCEMGGSTRKHGSLRFAHGQIALYATARHLGGLRIIGKPTVEDVARMAVESGVYEDNSLTCEVYDSTGAVSYGRFPAGVTRACRHRQDPSVVSGVKGHAVDVSWRECNSVRSGGVVTGIADTFCLLAAGLPECARELRGSIPTATMLKLERLRNAIA